MRSTFYAGAPEAPDAGFWKANQKRSMPLAPRGMTAEGAHVYATNVELDERAVRARHQRPTCAFATERCPGAGYQKAPPAFGHMPSAMQHAPTQQPPTGAGSFGPSLALPGLSRPPPASFAPQAAAHYGSYPAQAPAYPAAPAPAGAIRCEQAQHMPPRFGAYSREPYQGPGAYQGGPGAYQDFGYDESESDMSALHGTVRTPAQLRPSSEWVPETPASREQPPGYDGRPAEQPAGYGRGPINRQLFAQAPMPSRTQPFDVDFKDDYIIDGQELATGQRGKIPTPARSNRAREIAIQTNRQSIDGHAQQAAAEKGRRLGSIMRRNGAPGIQTEDDEDEGPSGPMKPVSEVQYPQADVAVLGSTESQGPTTWQGRAAMAQGLSQAIAEEMAELEHAWRLDEAEGKNSTEHVVAATLRKIAKKAEKAGVTQALLPSKSAEEDASTQARCKRLQAEIAQADARLTSLGYLGDRADDTTEKSCREALCKVVASLSAEAEMEGEDEVTGVVEQPVSFEMWLQRLAAVDAALRRQQAQLEDSRQELEERERTAIAKSFAHLPGGALDGVSALMAVQ